MGGGQHARPIQRAIPDIGSTFPKRFRQNRFRKIRYGKLRQAWPGDISIAGFDDIPTTAQTEPPLIIVRQVHGEKGYLAGQALVGLVRGEAVAEQHTDLPVRLVVRGSSGPAPHEFDVLR